MDRKNTLPGVPTCKLRGKAIIVTQPGKCKNSSESPPGFSSPIVCDGRRPVSCRTRKKVTATDPLHLTISRFVATDLSPTKKS